ncbi:carbohydrate deacetylase-like [Ostrea edulis]|uniref:carbohydrate deacetylase-like n=1 Tax=Ostrea edulis TaxID=37623 RepID=UPI0024AEADC4|nr:carbohydrate deacetylase-like [Ostrea edulis]
MRKLLVINADDFGYSVERNRGMVDCFREGVISGVTMMVNGIAAEDGARRAKEARMPTGMHLNVTEGIPVGTKRSTLTDENGHFLGNLGFRKAMANGDIDLDDFKKEMQSQIDRFESLMGHKPTHIDGHQHAHLVPGVCEVFGSLLQENRVRSTRCPYEDLEPNHVYSWSADAVDDFDSFFRKIVQDAARAKNSMKESDIWVTDRFVGLQTMGPDMTLERLQRQIAKVYGPPGNDVITCELMVHPGYRTSTEGGCGIGPDDFSMSGEREHEMSILRSKEMLEFYHKQGIEIVSFEQCYSL